MKTLAVIPARYASTRLPGKPLIEIAGIPLVVRVLENVSKCSNVDRVIVATDDERIAELVSRHGGEAVMTPPELPSGGRPRRLRRAARALRLRAERPGGRPPRGSGHDRPARCGARRRPVRDARAAREAHRAPGGGRGHERRQSVFDARGRALYFSRSPIPYPRCDGGVWYKHIGPYGWRRDFLLDFAESAQTPLEKTESLEMLRVLERGHTIRCVEALRDTIEIDTPDDLVKIAKYFAVP